MRNYRIFFLDNRSCYLNSLGDAFAQNGNSIFYQTSWNIEEVLAGIRYFKPDILLTIGCEQYLQHAPWNLITEICQQNKITHVYWATEDKIHHEYWSLPFIAKIKPDLIWTIHPDCVQSYEKLGIPSNYLNFAFNPRIFPSKHAISHALEPYDISFIGTTHLHRKTYRYDSLQDLLFPLIQAKRQVDIWGSGWIDEKAWIEQTFNVPIPLHSLHGFLPYKKTQEIYHQSKIVLGVQNAQDQVTQRTFEILGSGCLVIASRTTALSKMFDEGTEIIFTDGPKNTIEIAEYYLNYPEERRKIGQKAREKVLAHYTFSKFLPQIWPQLELIIQKKKV